MYIPKAYLKESWKDAKKVIEKYPLASIVTIGEDGRLIGGCFPFFLYDDEETGKHYLQAHVAGKNPLVPLFEQGKELFIIFTSDDSYITPSYYPEKPETHKFVPTWCFATVHIHGKPTLIRDSEFILKQLNRLTDQQEKTRSDPWEVSDAPDKYRNLLLKAIVGLEVEITDFECKYKFEQGTKARNVAGVVKGLREDGKPEVAKYVEEEN